MLQTANTDLFNPLVPRPKLIITSVKIYHFLCKLNH